MVTSKRTVVWWCREEDDIWTCVVPAIATRIARSLHAGNATFNRHTVTLERSVKLQDLVFEALPGLNRVTPSPTSIAIPELSWPRPFSPVTTMSSTWPSFQQWTSEPLIPVARTCIRHCPGPGLGIGPGTRCSPWLGFVYRERFTGFRVSPCGGVTCFDEVRGRVGLAKLRLTIARKRPAHWTTQRLRSGEET